MTWKPAPRCSLYLIECALLACAMRAHAGGLPESPSADTDAASALASDSVELPHVRVDAQNSAIESPRFPASTATIDADAIGETVNAVDVEDAAKYLPSLLLRKRNYGDTQAVLATRTWGVGSSARTLVFVDDIPISALIANNNTIGAPRWGVISPQQVERVTMLYGPFSAAYAGNSLGGVMRVDTRAPQQTEFTFARTQALQSFDQYRTHGDYSTSQSSATFGGRGGAFSWFVGANVANSFSQPLAYVTAATPPAGTSGAIDARNRVGQPADVLGAGGLLHTRLGSIDAKLGLDLGEAWHATYLFGYWHNETDSRAQTYLSDADGHATFGGANGFATNTYTLDADHLMQGFAIKSDTGGTWDAEAVATYYDFLHDRQLSPAAVAAGTAFSPNGRRADLAGTHWATLDLKGIWRAPGLAHEVSFGVHADEYALENPTRNTAAWQDGASVAGLFTSGRGTTDTHALWLQDAWTIAPAWLATLGVRHENWRASDGFNLAGGVGVRQPSKSADAWSPKATVQWSPAADWRISASLARAVRFPTVAELYQIVATGSTFTAPDANLAPERARSGELAIEHDVDAGSVRVSLFQENTRDALIAQTATLANAPVPVSFVQNVGEVRNRGIEFVARRSDVLLRGLELAGSVTFVDSTILSDPGFVSAAGTQAVGKHAPNVPRWRATAVATYRPDAHWALTLAGRYSGRQYSTLDNTDTTHAVFGAFDRFLVFDARVRWRANERVAVGLGIDNLTDADYFLFHPFPRRTVIADVDLTF